MKSVAIVLGTYNRLPCLQRAIASIRSAVGALPYTIIVSDGGSTDGTVPYLARCDDVVYLKGGLEGAVVAFNAGFGHAVDHEYDYVMHLNDDAEIVTAATDELAPRYPIAEAIELMERLPTIGEVAFELDLRGGWGWETINGVPYANFGVIRREAGMAVAREQGDPTGRLWWNPIYYTYGADCEFGANLWKLGWHIHPAKTLRVHDLNERDALRETNHADNKHGDSDQFWERWRAVDLMQYVPDHIKLHMGLMAPRRTPPRPHPRGRSGNRGGTCP